MFSMHPEDVRARDYEWLLAPAPPLPRVAYERDRYYHDDAPEKLVAYTHDGRRSRAQGTWSTDNHTLPRSVAEARLTLLYSWPDGLTIQPLIDQLEAAMDKAGVEQICA